MKMSHFLGPRSQSRGSSLKAGLGLGHCPGSEEMSVMAASKAWLKNHSDLTLANFRQSSDWDPFFKKRKIIFLCLQFDFNLSSEQLR